MLNISLPSNCKYSMDRIFYVTKKNDWRADWKKKFRDLFPLRFPRSMLWFMSQRRLSD